MPLVPSKKVKKKKSIGHDIRYFFQEKYKRKKIRKKEARQKISKIMFYTEHFHQFQSRLLQVHKHYYSDTL